MIFCVSWILANIQIIRAFIGRSFEPSMIVQVLAKSGFSFEAMKDIVNNFEWKRGVTNCTTLEFLIGVHIVYVVCLYLVQQYAVIAIRQSTNNALNFPSEQTL